MNKNPSMKKGGLKGSFPSGNGGSLSTGLSSRESMDSGTGMTDRRGPQQLPAPAVTVPFKGKGR